KHRLASSGNDAPTNTYKATSPQTRRLLSVGLVVAVVPSVEDASVVGQGCPGIPTRSGTTGWQDHSNPGSRRLASSLRTPGGIAICLFQSMADFFYLSWHLLRSLFMSQEALEREIAEMRRQIAELKADAHRPTRKTKTRPAGPEQHLCATCVVALMVLPVD